jgi:uncharacterized membrane protein
MVVGVLWLTCKALVAPALIYALVVRINTGRTPGLSESYRWGLGRMIPVILCGICLWIAVAAGFLLLIIPGIILSTAFTVAYPMAVLEGGGPIEILKRSYELTYGHKVNIFFAGLLLGIIFAVMSIPVALVVAMTGAANLWPVAALGALVTDVLNEGSSVFALVVYLSLVSTSQMRENLATPAPL